MPGIDGAMTQSESAAVAAWFDQRWCSRICTLCGSKDWHVYTKLEVTPVSSFVVCACNGCGHSVRFDAVAIARTQAALAAAEAEALAKAGAVDSGTVTQ